MYSLKVGLKTNMLLNEHENCMQVYLNCELNSKRVAYVNCNGCELISRYG